MYLATHESVTVAHGQRQENTDWVKNQSDYKIRYRALSKKKNIYQISWHKFDVICISFLFRNWSTFEFWELVHCLFRERFFACLFASRQSKVLNYQMSFLSGSVWPEEQPLPSMWSNISQSEKFDLHGHLREELVKGVLLKVLSGAELIDCFSFAIWENSPVSLQL